MFPGRYFLGGFFAPRYFPRPVSDSLPAAAFPCYSAAVLRLLPSSAEAHRLNEPAATVRGVLSPTADVRSC